MFRYTSTTFSQSRVKAPSVAMVTAFDFRHCNFRLEIRDYDKWKQQACTAHNILCRFSSLQISDKKLSIQFSSLKQSRNVCMQTFWKYWKKSRKPEYHSLFLRYMGTTYHFLDINCYLLDQMGANI